MSPASGTVGGTIGQLSESRPGDLAAALMEKNRQLIEIISTFAPVMVVRGTQPALLRNEKGIR